MSDNVDAQMNTVTTTSNDNKFTTANLIGLFATLIFCLVTQPWGSLIYSPLRKRRSWFSWIVTPCFFLWRLNPLACAAETVLIIASFLYSISRSWNQPFGKRIEALHGCAMAILLLRAGEYDDTLVKAAIERHLEASSNAADASSGDHFDSTRHQIPATLSLSRQDTASDIADQLLPTSIPLRRSKIPQTHNTTQLQQNRGSIDEQEAASELPAIARQQWLVGLFTIFVPFTVLIKLLGVSIPWPIRTAAFFMWMSWFTVQITLYLYDLRVVDDRVLRAALVAVSHQTFVANHKYLLMCIHFLIVPAMIYVGYVVRSGLAPVLDLIFLDDPIFPWINEHAPQLHLMLYIGYHVTYVPLLIVWSIMFGIAAFTIPVLCMILISYTLTYFPSVRITNRITNRTHRLILKAALGFPVIWGFVFLFIFSPYSEICFYYIDKNELMLATIGALYLSFILASRYFNYSDKLHELAICINIYVWVYLFIGVLDSYDATGTYKPGWLEYLG